MDSLRRELDRLREQVGGRAIVLDDGSTFRFSRNDAPVQLYMHAAACMTADYHREPRPAPPEVFRAVARARNRRAALRELYPAWPENQPLSAYDLAALVETGELIAKPFAPGYPPITEEA